ncbi:MAG: hypothetical protein SOZ00_00465 [Tidjanibacter sp.]|nr:hypothetical protein [Tidjanibacter sp.]
MRRLAVILALLIGVAPCGAARNRGVEDLKAEVSRLCQRIDATDDPVERIAIADSLKYVADQLPLCLEKADAVKNYAATQQSNGSEVVAHDCYWQAIDMFEHSSGDNERSISDCYYRLAIDYLNAEDTVNMRLVVEKLDQLRQRSADHLIGHDYYAVKSAYYSVLFDSNPDSLSLRDTFIEAGKLAIKEAELLSAKEAKVLNPVWDYFNVALYYNQYFTPPLTDSVQLYLDRAERVASNASMGVLVDENLISIYQMRAELELERGNYQKAERHIRYVVELLDRTELNRPNTLINERNEVYKFYVKLYSGRHDWRRAFEYQKLLTDSDKKRYDLEKAEAIDNVRTEYAIEKHKRRITDLEEANRRAWVLLGTTLIIALLLVGAVVAVVLYSRQRKINFSQKLYEAALTAELSTRALSQLKENLSTSPTVQTREVLRQQLRTSHLSPERVAHYDKALESLSVDNTDRLLLSTKENLTAMDKKYLLCYMIGMTTDDICTMFSVEPASVYVVKYRIKKKFADLSSLPV